jgi:hypothetical protein
MRKPDIRNVPIRDKELAILTARVLQRVTGDKCCAMWNSVDSFVLVRQTPEGKTGKG